MIQDKEVAVALEIVDVGLDVALMGAGVVAGAARERLKGVLPARRLWPFDDVRDVSIVLANSASTHTGEHIRPGTGVGQVRALGVITPSIMRAHRSLPSRAVQLEHENVWERIEHGDVVSIGGPKSNHVTRDILTQALAGTGVGQDDARIVWDEDSYRGLISEGHVRHDYGLVLRCPNPFNRVRTAVVFSGSHTYGTTAAARWYVESRQSPRKLGRHFVALVACKVRSGHVLDAGLVRSRALED